MQILNSKIFSEFLLSKFYFILNIYLLIIGLIFTKYLYSIYNNVLIIDLSILSIIFLLFFNYYLYDINIDLFLGFKLIIFYVFIKLNFVKNLIYKFRVKEVGFFINLLYKKFLNVVFESTYKKLQLENVLKQRKKYKSGLIQRTRRDSSIIKRFYYKSNVFFVNLFEVLKKGNLITKKTLHKQYKSNCHLSNKEAKIDFEIKGVDSVAAEHFVHINGINFYKEKEFDIKIFSPFTKGELHPILFDKNELEKFQNLGINFLNLPTLKVHLKDVEIENKFLDFKNKSLVKTYLPDNLKISVKENELQEFDLKKGVEIKKKEEKVMELLERKGYTLFSKEKQIYLVPDNDIKKEGDIIIKVNFENAIKMTANNSVDMLEAILNKNELNEYLNITTELKNSYEHVIKAIKKD